MSGGLVLTVMLMSMTAGAMCLNKVAPILSELSASLKLGGGSQSGLLISIFVLSGIFLAIPIGMIIAKCGMYRSGAVALLAIVIGSLIGAQNVSYEVMLISRAIEGIGLIFLATIGPVAVTNTFAEKNRGTAMGLLMCFMAFGQIIMMNFAPWASARFSWKGVWWTTAVYAAVLLVIWLITMRRIDAIQVEEHTEKSVPLREVLTNKSLWLVGLVLMLFLIAQQGVTGFWATYLNEVRGVDSQMAGSLISIASVVGIPVGIAVGGICDKVGSRRKPLGILMLACAAVYALMPVFPTSAYAVMIVLYGIATMGVVGVCFSMVSDAVNHSREVGLGSAFLNTMQWIGIFLSSTLFGIFQEGLGWNAAFFILVPISLLGAVLAFVNKKIR